MKKAYLSLVVAIAMLAFAPLARANDLTAGSTVTPSNYNGGANLSANGGTIVALTGWQNWSYSTTTGTTSGLYDQWVVTGDASNPYGANDVTIFTTVQVNSGSADPLSKITESSFGNYATSVGYDNTTYVSFTSTYPYVDPNSVDRTLNGDIIGFNWTVANPLAPGTWSAVLVIYTNATSWTTGQVGLIDSATTDLAGFAPSGAAVPEPGTAGLLALGLLALGAGTLLKRRQVPDLT